LLVWLGDLSVRSVDGMSRRTFLVIASAVPGLFGLVMMLVPTVMLDNSLTAPADDYTVAVTRWVGFAVFSIAWITFFSSSDAGSPALRAVMTGNIAFHLLGVVMDSTGYAAGIMTASGLITGLVPHTVLAAGFAFYLTRASRESSVT
jgi:hypothetical protein